jgi:outer membrane protein OmpA-like peptidoglycan-associated protein
LGLGLSLGGCNKQLKEDNAALMTQNSALIAENNQLKSNQDAMTDRIKNLETTTQANNTNGTNGNGNFYAPDSAKISGKRGHGSETIVVAGDVLFDPGQATIKAAAKKELDKIASTLNSKHNGQDIRVEGYTDTKPLNKSKKQWGTNEALSEARADAVRKYLVSKGVSSSHITAVGMGAAKPKATDKDSRRVEIVVVDG